MPRRSTNLFFPLFLIYFLAGCSALLSPPRTSWPLRQDGHFMHVGAFLQVSGTARAPEGMTTETQRRAESRDLAIVDAWDRLREYLYDLPLSGYGNVRIRAKEEPAYAKKIETMIYSMQVVETRFSSGVAAVVLRIKKDTLNSVLETDFR
jgi:hypothetical protein